MRSQAQGYRGAQRAIARTGEAPSGYDSPGAARRPAIGCLSQGDLGCPAGAEADLQKSSCGPRNKIAPTWPRSATAGGGEVGGCPPDGWCFWMKAGPGGNWNTTTLIHAIDVEGTRAAMITDGPTNAAVFEGFVRWLLVP